MTQILPSDTSAAALPNPGFVDETCRHLLKNAPDAIFIAGLDGRYIYANEAACRLLGYEQSEIVGKAILDLIPEAETARLADEKAQMLEGRAHVSQWKLRRKDGRFVDVEVSANILPSGHWQGFVRDISERKEREAAFNRLLAEIENERRRLSTVLDTVPLGIVLFLPGGGISFNDHAEDLLGIDLDAKAQTPPYASSILFPDGTPVPRDRLPSSRVVRHGETILGEEYLVARADGSRVPVLESAAPIRDAEGRVTGGVAAFQDISDRMAAERAVRENERLLNGIFNLLPVGVWIADKSGRIVRANPAGLKVWAGARYVGPSEFDQYRGWWLATGEPIAAEDWALARALAKGETSIGELIRIQCFDGTFKIIRNSALPLQDERGEFAGAIVVNEDITALNETEEALRRALHARDEVLSIVAHDLRGPLSVISLKAHSLAVLARASKLALPEDLAMIEKQVGRMNRLIYDLLDIARMDAGELRLERTSVSPIALLEEACMAHRPAAEQASIDLRKTHAEVLPRVWADAQRLAQVIENLLGNSLKFTGSGGSIECGAAPEGGAVRFWVSDSGPGVPADQLSRLFDRYWQVNKRDRRGAGLGLAIAKGIVEAHGGRICAESKAGKGTTISFTIPVGAPDKSPSG